MYQRIAGLFLICMLLGFAAGAQHILLDKPVKAGELTLFPDMEDGNAYYYLPDQLKLATDPNGKPQFSFLRYVENVRSAAGEEEEREGTGGGILHAVIELSVSPEQLQEAQNELRRVNAGGTIKGPVMYNGGTMAVVSSFVNTEGDLSKQVVGIGKAPLIDGQKAAISMELTKKGAKILWESLHTSTPDMSFSFEMELEGYRSPQKAMIEADFEKIYSHHAFQMGASGNYNNIVFGGEIDLAFDELRNNGAIKITNMGADSSMEKLIETAYNKLTTLMFDPIGGTGNPVLQDLVKKATGQKSPMERATELYKQNKGGSKAPASKSSAKKKTSMLWQYPGLNDNMLLAYSGNYYPSMFTSATLFPQAGWQPKPIKETFVECMKLLTHVPKPDMETCLKLVADDKYCSMGELVKSENANSNKAYPVEFYQTYLLSESEKVIYSDIINGKKEPDEEYKQLIRERVVELVYAQDFLNEAQKTYILNEAEPDPAKNWGITQSLTYGAWVTQHGNPHPASAQGKKWLNEIAELGKSATVKTQDDSPVKQGDTKPDDAQKKDPATLLAEDLLKDSPSAEKGTDKKEDTKTGDTPKDKKPATATATKSQDTKEKKNDKQKTTSAAKKNEKKTSAKKDGKKSDFKLAVMASYQFKKIKQKGNFKINLNKYTTDKLVLRFDENIGKIDCDECFYQVNLDDPLYKQREIVAMVDGFNATDFGKYINYVSLKMKKVHQSGDVTYDEVRIDRDNFVRTANNFKVLYGWKGDNDRSDWLDYEYQAQWSFFGGNEVDGEWKEADANAINLTPPYLRKTIELEADPDLLKDKNVRSIDVKLYYKIGDRDEVKQVTLMPSRDQYSAQQDIMVPQGYLNYDYEITWRMTGNKTVTSGRQTTSEQILFVDEVEM